MPRPAAPDAVTQPIAAIEPLVAGGVVDPRRRARPLPPEERRAALITATLSLIRQHGADVSTRQIAQACGVAEGTIFRVFPDKESLLREALEAAFDPAPFVATLRELEVDRSATLDERLVPVVRLMQQRISGAIDLLVALRMRRPPDGAARPLAAVTRATRAASDETVRAVARFVTPDRAQLRRTPLEVADLLRLLVLAGAHPGITDGRPLTAEEIVEVVLDGVRKHETPSRPGSPRSC